MSTTYSPHVTYTFEQHPDSTIPLDPPQYDAHENERFQRGAYYRDKPFLFLFLLQLAAVIVVFGLSISKQDAAEYEGFIPNIDSSDMGKYLTTLGFTSAAALGTALALLALMRIAPRAFIWGSLLSSMALFLASGITVIAKGYSGYAIIFGIFLLIWVWFLCSIVSYIPFLAELLRTVVMVVQHYPATIVLEFVAVLIQAGWTMFWGYTLLVMQPKFSRDALTALTIFLCLSYFWTMQVIRNIVHTTHSGVIATWYFMTGTSYMPENPTLASLRRASTTSLGSICLGSLIVAIIQTLRTLLQSIRRESNWSAIADCLLSFWERIARYFNHYAFVYCAIYGKEFCESARSVMRLFVDTGLLPIVNDAIIDKVIFIGCLLGSIVGGITGYFGSIAVGVEGDDAYAMLAVGVALGWIIMSIVLQVIDSGIATIFVCFAEDRETLQHRNPGLYNKLMEKLSHA